MFWNILCALGPGSAQNPDCLASIEPAGASAKARSLFHEHYTHGGTAQRKDNVGHEFEDAGLEDPKYLAAAGFAIEIHAPAIPMVVEMAALDGMGRQVGKEQTDAFAAATAHTRVHEPI